MCYANSDESFPNKTVLFDILAFQADTNKQKVSPCRFTTSACALNMYFMVAVTQNMGGVTRFFFLEIILRLITMKR